MRTSMKFYLLDKLLYSELWRIDKIQTKVAKRIPTARRKASFEGLEIIRIDHFQPRFRRREGFPDFC